jgi:hypothetical protein
VCIDCVKRKNNNNKNNYKSNNENIKVDDDNYCKRIDNKNICLITNNYDNNNEKNIENNDISNHITVNNKDTDLSFDFSTKTVKKIYKTISNNDIEKTKQKSVDYFEIDVHSNKETFTEKNDQNIFVFNNNKFNTIFNCIQIYIKNLILFIENYQTLQKIFILTSFIEAHNHSQRKIPCYLGFLFIQLIFFIEYFFVFSFIFK